MKKKKERRVYQPRIVGGQVMMPADLKSDYGLFAPDVP
jgi:hypothetical protein